MKWIIFAILGCCAFAEEASIMYCVPFKLKPRLRQDLIQETAQCLANNFKWNSLNLEPWADSYMAALDAKQQVEKADTDFFYVRRELMLTLRDIQFRSSHHMHAIHECAKIGHRIPKYILESYTRDTHLTVKAVELWNHHISQDVARCIRIVRTIISEEQEHMEHHLVDDQLSYDRHRATLLAARDNADATLRTMHAQRQEIIDAVA